MRRAPAASDRPSGIATAAEAGGPAGAVPREVEVDGPAVVVVVVVSGKAGVIAETAGRGGEVV